MKRISLITWSSALVAIVAMAPEVAAQSTSTTSPNPADPPRPTVKTGEAKPAVPEAKPAAPTAKPEPTPAAKAAAKPAAKKPAKPAAKVKTVTPAPVLLGVDANNNKPQSADTTRLPQFEQAVEYEPRSPSYKVSFSLEDADLNELVRVIGQLTGKRFIFGGRVRNIKASVYSPQKVTVEEAYEAFLSILDSNGLTVVPHGKFLKIVETGGISSQTTPMSQGTDRIPTEDRFITRLQRIGHVSADEVAGILGHFKSKDADITVYSPGNMLIITDTGANIRRMMDIVNEIDTVGVGDQIWIEPIHYGSASDMASRVNDIFDLRSSGSSSKGGGGGGASVTAGSDLHVSKVISDDRSNSLIIVSTERAYLRILEFLKRIDTPSAGEGEIHVLALQHADATELYKTLNEIVTNAGSAGSSTTGQYGAKASTNAPNQNIFEGGVKVSADKATNSIVITSSNRDYAAMRAVLDKLDQPRRQVFIEAVIMDLSIGHTLSLGVSFHGGAQEDLMGPGKSTIIGGLNVLKSLGPPTANTDLIQGMALGIRGPDIPGSQNFSSTGLSIPAFGAVINAMAMNNDKDVLSTPHILATDNIKAEINVGENTPLQTSSGGIGGLGALAGAAGGGAGGLGALGALGGLGGGFSPQRQDVGTKIIITPHLNESNEVRLELQEEISEVGQILVGNLGAIPITKRTANTTLIVRDQQTVVIGGLMKNSVLHTQEKVPLLGDIPVLGVLFRSSKDSTTKSNLILILTPYIIREQSDLRAIFERKMQERQQFLDRYFVFSDDQDYQAPKDYSRTNGLVEHIRQSFIANAERARLDDLSRPKDVKSHTPGQPLEIVNGRNQTPSNLNVAPPPRSVPVRGGNFDHDD